MRKGILGGQTFRRLLPEEFCNKIAAGITRMKNDFSFFSQGKFAWVSDGEEEFNLIKVMKKASKLSISASDLKGNKTRDLYSMMGFTKSYNTAKKSCA